MAVTEVASRARRLIVVAVAAGAAGAAQAAWFVERANGSATANLETGPDYLFAAVVIALPLGWGVRILWRRSAMHGWLLVAAGSMGAIALLQHALAIRAARAGDVSPFWFWPSTWMVGLSLAMLCLVPARVLWPRGNRFEWVCLTAIAVVIVVEGLSPGSMDGVGPGLPPPMNPWGVASVADVGPWISLGAGVLLFAYAAAACGTLAFSAIRGRRKAGSLPWVMLAFGLPATALGAAAGAATGFGWFEGGWLALFVWPLLVAGSVLAWTVRSWQAERRTSAELRRTASVRDEERKRVRRDLHDGIGPALAGMRLQVEALRDLLPADSVAVPAVDLLRGTLDDTLGELRRIVDGMRPSLLEDRTIGEAIGDLTRSMTSDVPGAPTVTSHITATPPEIPASVESALLRVCAEALSNAVRHGRPTACRVSLSFDDGLARLSVADDGPGIDGSPKGMGMRSMRARIEEVGGVLSVGPGVDGSGTLVSAQVPILAGGPR